MLRGQQVFRAHQGLLGVLGGCIGTGRECRYSGAKNGMGAPRGGRASGVY